MNIKRILTILTVCAACSTLGASTVDYTLLVLQPATVDVTQGQSFSATVNLFEVYVQDPFNPLPPDSVAGFQFDLMYPSFLSVDSVAENGLFLAYGAFFTYDASTPGSIVGISDVFSGGITEIPMNLDTLITVQFTAVGTGSGNISLNNILLVDDNFGEIVPDPSSSLTSLVTSSAAGGGQGSTSAPEPSSLVPCGLLAGGWLLRRRRAGA